MASAVSLAGTPLKQSERQDFARKRNFVRRFFSSSFSFL
jgi:uncharacterized protein (UPF0303 family)